MLIIKFVMKVTLNNTNIIIIQIIITKKLIFNYDIDNIRILKEEEEKNKYNYECIISNELII